MKNRASKLLCWLMSILLCAQLVPTQALAYPTPQVVEGTYSFTTAISNDIHITDTFAFREDCFMRSSFEGCTHLSELSAQLAMTAYAWFGEKGDPYEDAVSDTAHNMKNILTSMGFSDVQTNGYCQTDTLADSVGAAIGRRIISVGNNDYTLLAIPIRSSGYKREWVGNLTVGNGDFVKGFKDARDEVLRFVKQYVSTYGITGNVKIWVTGHSRGAAVANMVGGFFADGGAAYLDNNVSVTPKDVYCYCYAPPATIKAGASKAEALSVSAARDGAYQAKDTPGEAYVSKAKGTVNPLDASTYGGIRYYINRNDVVPMLPPDSWGFARYGTNCPLDSGIANKDQMATELAGLSEVIYNTYVNGGDPDQYSPVMLDVLNLNLSDLDLNKLPFVPADGQGQKSFAEFMSERVAGLAKVAPSNAAYTAGGYEDTLRATAGTVFLVNDKVIDGGLAGTLKADADNNLVKSLVFGYLAYASEQLINQGRATNEAEATAIVLEDLLSYVNGTSAQVNTVGDLLVFVGQFFTDHEDTPLAQSLLDVIVAAVPDDADLINTLIALPMAYGHYDYDQVEIQSDNTVDDQIVIQSDDGPILLVDDEQNEPDDTSGITLSTTTSDSNLTDEEADQLAKAFGTTLSNLSGKEDALDTDVVIQNDQGEVTDEMRQQLKRSLVTFFKDLASDKYDPSDPSSKYGPEARNVVIVMLPFLKSYINIDFGRPKEDTPVTETLGTVLASLMKRGDDESFASLAEASEGFFAAGIDAVKPALIGGARNAYSDSYAAELEGYLSILASHPVQMRDLLVGIVFGTEGYNSTSAIVTLSTLVNNINTIVFCHTNEQYLAWMRAVRKAANEGPHSIYRSVTVSVNTEAGGTAYANTSEELPGTTVSLSAETKTGYNFAGWSAITPKGLTIQNNSFIMPDSDVEARANFKPITYKVAFVGKGGTGSMKEQSFTYNTKQALAANAFTRKGYTFVGWNTKSDGTGKSYRNKQEVKNLASQDGTTVTLYAQWKKDAPGNSTYTVAFMANGGKGSMAKQSFTYGAKKALRANAFTRKGYTFVGWNTKANGSGKAYKNKQEVKNLTSKNNGTVTLYAQWKKNKSKVSIPSVSVTTHMQNLGWRKASSQISVAGDTKKSLRLEAVSISVPNSRYSGGIEYRSHIQNLGWERAWTRNGKTSGTTGKSYRLEGIQIRLYGKMKEKYDVYYRIHAKNIGWMAWAKNGQKAGTQGMSCRTEALQVVLVKKGSKAPSKIYKGAIQSTTKRFIGR